MLVKEKVIKLDNTITYDEIIRFLERKERRSKNTRTAYEGDIRLFFKIVRNKEIEYLSVDDVQLTLNDFEDFIKQLTIIKDIKGNRIYSNKTINRKITSVKELIKYLSGKEYNNSITNEMEPIVKDISFFHHIETLPETTDSFDALLPDEVFKMAELAAQEKEKSLEKKLLFMFALHTGLRKSEILSVKWKDFTVLDDDLIMIKGIGKGKKQFKRYILKEFYEELLPLKKINRKYVFSIGESTLNKLFERVRDKMNFNDGRNIVFHSIRKCSATFLYQLTNDIELVRKFLNHSNITTTQIYLNIDSKDDKLKSAILINKIDQELYKKVDHDMLIQAISQMDSSQIMLLNKKIMEITNNNS